MAGETYEDTHKKIDSETDAETRLNSNQYEVVGNVSFISHVTEEDGNDEVEVCSMYLFALESK